MQRYSIPLEELQSRRQKLNDKLPNSSAAILYSAQELIMSNDTRFPFRQNSDFWYLTGYNQPESCFIQIKNGEKTTAVAFSKPVTEFEKTWYGSRPDFDEVKSMTGVDQVESIDNFAKTCNQILSEVKMVYTNAENEKLILLKEKFPHIDFRPISQILSPLRLLKSLWELDQMKLAAQHNIQAHRVIKNLIEHAPQNNLFTEYGIQAQLEFEYKKQNLDPAYPCIVGGGSNATVLHYIQNDCEIVDGDLVLVDAGCHYNYYASDITQTYCRGGKRSTAQEEIYSLVLKAQLEVENLAKKSLSEKVTIRDLHNQSVYTLVQGLLDLGILKGTVEQNVTDQTYRRYYMHGSSHWLGLDVHDVGSYKDEQGNSTILEPGMVFTNEPGLYFRADDQTVLQQYRGIGVRIEDDLVITSDGVINLTGELEK